MRLKNKLTTSEYQMQRISSFDISGILRQIFQFLGRLAAHQKYSFASSKVFLPIIAIYMIYQQFFIQIKESGMNKKANALKKYFLKGPAHVPLEESEVLYEQTPTEFFDQFHQTFKVIKKTKQKNLQNKSKPKQVNESRKTMKKSIKTELNKPKINFDNTKIDLQKKIRNRSNSQRPKSSSTQKTVKKMVRNCSVKTTRAKNGDFCILIPVIKI